MDKAPKTSLLSNKTFDVLKFIAQIFLPAVGTMYFSLAGIWHLPNADQVVGTVVSLDTFLGVLLGLQTRTYNNSDAKYDGSLNVFPGVDKTTFSLDLNGDPADLVKQNNVSFKVVKG